MWEYIEFSEDGNYHVVRLTEGQILAEYWDWWSQKMREKGRRRINPDRCIEDWAVVHWAVKVPEKYLALA